MNNDETIKITDIPFGKVRVDRGVYSGKEGIVTAVGEVYDTILFDDGMENLLVEKGSYHKIDGPEPEQLYFEDASNVEISLDEAFEEMRKSKENGQNDISQIPVTESKKGTKASSLLGVGDNETKSVEPCKYIKDKEIDKHAARQRAQLFEGMRDTGTNGVNASDFTGIPVEHLKKIDNLLQELDELIEYEISIGW